MGKNSNKTTEPGGHVAAETADFRRLVANKPREAKTARRFDEMARETLKNKYLEFDQGTYEVIEKRSVDIPHESLSNSENSHKSAKNGAKTTKYYCKICKDHKDDADHHLQVHNMHPGQSIYCPVCLDRMCRRDGVTIVEHMINKHPEYVFGGVSRKMHEASRFKHLCDTEKNSILNRLNGRAIHEFIKKDQAELLDIMQNITPSHVQEMEKQAGVDVTALRNVISAQKMALDHDGLATYDVINALKEKKRDGIEYLKAVRNVLKQMKNVQTA